MVSQQMQVGRESIGKDACPYRPRISRQAPARRRPFSSRALYRSLVPLLIILMLAGTPAALAQPAAVTHPASAAVSAAAEPLQPYIVHIADPDVLVVADEADELIAEARQRQAAELEPVLADLAARGLAGPYTFDETRTSVRVALSESARAELQGQPLVAALELDEEATRAASGAPMAAAPRAPASQSGVSSVIFAQVNTPFVWGSTAIGGLTVQLTLENSAGQIKGVPAPYWDATKTCKVPEHCVNVDPSLYFETIFIDPADSKKFVAIRPGDRIHVITSGDDPATPGDDSPQDKRVPIADVAACSSPVLGRVEGTTRANAPVVVTYGTSLSLSNGYLTPGSGMTYSEQRADASGHFSAELFRTSTDPNYKVMAFAQGTRGFVRVQVLDSQSLPTGDEVYTVYGQNAYILQNSPIMHGYAFQIPSAPSGLVAGVAATRPATTLTATLKDSWGGVMDTVSLTMSGIQPYDVEFSSATIIGGDVVEVTVSHGGNVAYVNEVRTVPITALADLAANQVTGKGPANTPMIVGAGNVQGYLTRYSTVNSFQTRVNSAGDGSYASGAVGCGAANNLILKPGSFGYVGYEGACGSFVYSAFAAPVNYVMSDFNFIDGWVADGRAMPTIAVNGPAGQPLQPPTQAQPQILWLLDKKLYINTYYNTATSVFLVPGSVVTIVSGNKTHTIPVDRLEARLYAGQNLVAGVAPAGGALRVVLEKDRTARKELLATADGRYAATSPYAAFNYGNCTETTKNQTVAFGDIGRVFLRHSDGNEVFTTFYTRALHALENEGTAWLTGYLVRGLDWPWILPTSARNVTITFTPAPGQTGAGTGTGSIPGNIEGKTADIAIKRDDAPTVEALIRAGGNVVARFNEGSDLLPRPVTLELKSLALVTASPDTDANTLAGVGPVHWSGADDRIPATFGPVDWAGKAYLKTPLSANVAIPYSGSTAYPAVQFKSGNNVIPLKADYRGTVNFLDPVGNEIYMWWGVTGQAYQVKIAGRLYAGATKVCGAVKAPAGYPLDVTVNIHNLTGNPVDAIIGTGLSNSQGLFCVTVNPALVKGEVVIAEVNGYRSQPVVVMGTPVFLPLVTRR